MPRERFERSGETMKFVADFTETPILEQAAKDTGVSFDIVTYPGRNRYFPSGGYSTLGVDSAEVEIEGGEPNLAEFQQRTAELLEMVGRVLELKQQVAETKTQQAEGRTS